LNVPGQVTIKSKRLDDFLEIYVSDNGSGVSSDLQEKIFDPYFTKGKEKGTGLGLPIAKKLMLSQSGDILYQANHPGSTFVLRFSL